VGEERWGRKYSGHQCRRCQRGGRGLGESESVISLTMHPYFVPDLSKRVNSN
jgi:hypothetical protein